MKFEIVSDYTPTGDQPQAIAKLARGMQNGMLLNLEIPYFSVPIKKLV